MIKTRQQLQGEMVSVMHGIKDLQLKAEKRKQPYKSIFQSVKSIVEAEGVRGLQKGLSAQLAFQFCNFFHFSSKYDIFTLFNF